MTLRERSGKRRGSAAFADTRNCSRAFASGSLGNARAPLRGQLDDPVPAFGYADHAPQRRKLFGREVSCGNAVGGDHEVLNNVFGPVLFVGFQVLELISVKDRTGFDCFEIKRAVQVPECFQFLGHAVLESKVLVETADCADPWRHRPVTLQPAGNAVVGELRTIAHRRSIKVRTLKRSIPGENHFNDDGQAV